MNILFIHQNFPGQYCHIINALAAQNQHQIVGMGLNNLSVPLPQNVAYVQYFLTRSSSSEMHPWLTDLESHTIRAESCAQAAHGLKKHHNFHPDIICCHSAWGEIYFLADIWPNVPIVSYQEFFYQPEGFDSNFDPEFQAPLDWSGRAQLRLKNINFNLSFEISNQCVTPTQFQRSSFPTLYQKEINVIHDGIDTHYARPTLNPSALTLPDGKVLNPNDPIVTFINRTLEPYRGCHTMIRAIPDIQRLIPNVQIVLIGSTKNVSYGLPCPSGEWKDYFFKEIEGQYDPQSIHFTDILNYQTQLIPLLQLSSAHVYLTYPFTLSWSLLDAMACGCPIIGSATKPVMEMIQDGENGLLVDFFDYHNLAEKIAHLISDKKFAKELGRRASELVHKQYSLQVCLPRHLELLSSLLH